ncbi:MAG: hypothetical protein IKT20_05620 [Clostridiales bacterium]|nr:hypothetical protein [Clostridiales bacterium]
MKGISKMAMTKEESIALAEKLSKKYKEYEDIRKEIDDNKQELARPVNLEHKPHAAFKFFWPFLVAAAASMMFFYFLMLIAGAVVLAGLFALMVLISPIVLLLVGSTRARRLRDELNSREVNEIREKKKRIKDLTDRNEELEPKCAEIKKELDEYEELIPMDSRNSARMDKALKLLQTGKAENFSQALEML